MEYTLKVKSTQPGERHYVEDGKEIVERWIEVAFDILGDEKVVAERIVGFKPDITPKEVKKELEKYLATYKSDIEIGEKSKEAGEANKNAIKIANDLDGFSI